MKQTINFKVPEGWDQLTDKQLRFVYALIDEDFSAHEISVLCLLKWSGTHIIAKNDDGNYIFQQDGKLFEATPLMVAEVLPHLSWLGIIPRTPVRISQIQGNKALPADFLDVPFEKYIMAENLYQGFLQTQSDDLLDQLASVLYGADMKLKNFERINIFYWMASLKHFFAERYKDFYISAAPNDSDNLLGTAATSVEEAMNAQIRALTKGDITKEKEILALDTWRALNELNAQAKEYQELSRKSSAVSSHA